MELASSYQQRFATWQQQQQQQQQFINLRRLSLAPEYINSGRECSAPRRSSAVPRIIELHHQLSLRTALGCRSLPSRCITQRRGWLRLKAVFSVYCAVIFVVIISDR